MGYIGKRPDLGEYNKSEEGVKVHSDKHRLWWKTEAAEENRKKLVERNKSLEMRECASKTAKKEFAKYRKEHPNSSRDFGYLGLLSQAKSKVSELEETFSFILDQLKVVYERQYRVGTYVADFFLPEHNMVVEIYGEYWHGNLNFGWTGVHSENDRKKEKFYFEKGLKFCAIYGAGLVKENLNYTKQLISALL